MSKPRSIFIHLHTLDLRIHDSPSLYSAHHPSSPHSSKTTHFLPIYIFDPRQLDLSYLSHTAPAPPPSHEENKDPNESLPANPNHRNRTNKSRASPKSRCNGFWRTSPYRLKNLLEAIYGLKAAYKRSGGDLLIGYGKPEILLPRLLHELKEKRKDQIVGIWAQNEVTVEECDMLDRVEVAVKKLGVDLYRNDSKTLMPTKALPFEVRKTPDVYTNFRQKVEGLGIALDKGLFHQPLKTAKWEHGSEGDLKVSIGEEGIKLKEFPEIPSIKAEDGIGEWMNPNEEKNTLEGMYKLLSKPILDDPPLGGWPKDTKSPEDIPSLHVSSAIPFGGSEADGLKRLTDYVGYQGPNDWVGGSKAKKYKATRNGMIGEAFSTKFSSWLALGTLSPKEIGWRVGSLIELVGRDKDVYQNVYWILFELLWRDFFQFTTHKYKLSSKSSLFNPDGYSAQIKTYPSDQRPNISEWHVPNWDDPEDIARKWCEGRTGVPFIDANIRELRETGWMSNRGRQNVASFLVKDLYVDWRVGAEFFEMHLVDYDTCSNWGNWQYQAGVGNDPRSSRQFNPIKQAADYDLHAEFVRLWIPELKNVPDDYAQTPWLMGDKSKLGDYPHRPIVEGTHWKKHYCRAGGGNRGSGHGGGNGNGDGGSRGNHSSRGRGGRDHGGQSHGNRGQGRDRGRGRGGAGGQKGSKGLGRLDD